MKCLIPNIGSTSFKYRLLEMPDESLVLAEGRSGADRPAGQRVRRLPCRHSQVHRRDCRSRQAAGKPLRRSARSDSKRFTPARSTRRRSSTTPFWPRWRSFRFSRRRTILLTSRPFRLFGRNCPAFRWSLSWSRFRTASWTRPRPPTPCPTSGATEYGIRRYGFHGASHRSASERTQAFLGRSDLRHISCHLGGSSSVAAFRNGVAIDTSMGASPQSGLPQNNRVGDIDVFAVLHMMKKLGLDPDQMAALLGTQSGPGRNQRHLRRHARSGTRLRRKGDQRSRLALDVFVRAIRHYLGAFLLELGGVDAITLLRRHRRKQRRNSRRGSLGNWRPLASSSTKKPTKPSRAKAQFRLIAPRSRFW